MYKISYVADGTTTEFAFSFPFFQCADICVAIDGVICAPEHNFAIIDGECPYCGKQLEAIRNDKGY